MDRASHPIRWESLKKTAYPTAFPGQIVSNSPFDRYFAQPSCTNSSITNWPFTVKAKRKAILSAINADTMTSRLFARDGLHVSITAALVAIVAVPVLVKLGSGEFE